MLSCCIVVNILVTLLLLVVSLERQVIDLLGYQWTPCIFDFITILLSLFGISAACQHRVNLSVVLLLWLLVWMTWNVFLMSLYLGVAGLNDDESSLLSWGTKKLSYWKILMSNCGNGTTISSTESVWFCQLTYQQIEVLHSSILLFLSLICLICQLSLFCLLRQERHLTKKKQRDVSERELSYIHLNDTRLMMSHQRHNTGTLESSRRSSLPWVDVVPSGGSLHGSLNRQQRRRRSRRYSVGSDSEDDDELPPYSPRVRSYSTGRRRKKTRPVIGQDNAAYKRDSADVETSNWTTSSLSRPTHNHPITVSPPKLPDQSINNNQQHTISQNSTHTTNNHLISSMDGTSSVNSDIQPPSNFITNNRAPQQRPVFVSTRALSNSTNQTTPPDPLYQNFPRGSYRQAIYGQNTPHTTNSVNMSSSNSLFV